METLFLSTLIVSVLTEDFCATDNFKISKGSKSLQFSKELSQQEFTRVDGFKSLHCCATAFRAIEWFKDDRPYPWPHNLSSLIINPASHNQTIYTQRAGEMDDGRYHCLVTNATHVIRHDVYLQIGASVGPPKPTYIPKDQHLQLGDNARLYCEAYVGNISLPDARNEIFWTKIGVNMSQDARVQQRAVYRQDKQVLGCFLTINNIEKSDFGQYLCLVSNTNDQTLEMSLFLLEVKNYNEEEWRIFTMFICLVALFIIIIMIVVIKCRTRCFKICQPLILCLTRKPQTDVTIFYTNEDASFVQTTVIPALVKFQYSYTSQIVNPHFLSINMKSCDIQSKRLLAIVNSSSTGDEWSCKNIHQVATILLKLHPKLICIFLQKLPEMDSRTEDGRGLRDILKKIHYITENETHDKAFWTIVCMGLPFKNKDSVIRESLEQLM